MRPLPALLLLLASLAAQGCSNTCQDLGDRLCQCAGAGSARTNCQTEVSNQIKATTITGTETAACAAALGTCNAPSGATFCEWITTACGKASCGLSSGTPATVCQ